jgi:hypothetical protein
LSENRSATSRLPANWFTWYTDQNTPLKKPAIGHTNSVRTAGLGEAADQVEAVLLPMVDVGGSAFMCSWKAAHRVM